MSATLPRVELGRASLSSFPQAAGCEWLLTNGIGGYAAGTIALGNTRRYHGLLVAALEPPVKRTVMIAKLDIHVDYAGRRYALTANEYADGTVHPQGFVNLQRFELIGGLPSWTWTVADAVVQQQLCMSHGENTTWCVVRVIRASAPVQLIIEPLCTYRDYHSHSRGAWDLGITEHERGFSLEAFPGAQAYRLSSDRGRFYREPFWHWNVRHAIEASRGLDALEDLYRPGYFQAALAAGEGVMLCASTASGDIEFEPAAFTRALARAEHLLAHLPPDAPEWVRQLTLAADQFIVERGAGGKTVIAGYPWFTDWGRDTMIALTGLAVATRRFDVAADVLRTFAQHVSQGMLPNRFPDGGESPEYNTVDATLWFFHAVWTCVQASGDRDLLRELYPVLRDILEWHSRGTRFGIGVDPADGLLRAGADGVQLTWMDAKIGDWVVTPRTGKPVEINALWHHATEVMARCAALLNDDQASRSYASQATAVAATFRRRFWNEEAGCLYDVIDTPPGTSDASVRPNQIFAVSLSRNLLSPMQAKSIVDTCARELWTPNGLRSLGTRERGYCGMYDGPPARRDAVYHQGTAWSWLLGPFVSAHFAVYGDAAAALSFLEPVAQHLHEACLGTISEIFDGDAPYAPKGCFAQAWSVAEILRAWHEIATARIDRTYTTPKVIHL